MSLALDESTESDLTFKIDGITFVVNKDLMEKARPIKVDFIDSGMRKGYSIESNLSTGNNPSCGGSCSC